MARYIKKPKAIKEQDLKENAGPVEIVLDQKKEELNLEALRALKAQEKYEAVIKAMANAAATKKSSNSKSMSFGTWFQKALTKNPKIKLSYKEAIESHCRSIGVAAQATEEEFEAALTHFGL